MRRACPSPRAIAAVAAGIVLAATSTGAAASATTPDKLTLNDIAGDANAVNDQGEGLIGNVRTGHQIDQADLRTVTAVTVPGRTPAKSSLRVSFTTTAAPASLPDGTPLAYGLLLVPGRDCRLTVEYITARTAGLEAPSAPTGMLIHTCDNGHYTEHVLRARVTGRTATVDVPHRLLPAPARAATGLDNGAAYVRTVPADGSAARPLELDSAR